MCAGGGVSGGRPADGVTSQGAACLGPQNSVLIEHSLYGLRVHAPAREDGPNALLVSELFAGEHRLSFVLFHFRFSFGTLAPRLTP
jgi:hypothetical protein